MTTEVGPNMFIPRPLRRRMPEDTDPFLIDQLQTMGDRWGPLGVAIAAAHLTDPNVLLTHLRRESDTDDALDGDRPEPAEPDADTLTAVQPARGDLPGIGAVVHFITPGVPFARCLPAIVVRHGLDDPMWPLLHVFGETGQTHEAVRFDVDHAARSWHWPRTSCAGGTLS